MKNIFLFGVLAFLLFQNTAFAASISTSDGLSISLSDTGAPEGVSIGGNAISMIASRGGFSFRENPSLKENILANPGFENGAAKPLNWSFGTVGGNIPVWDSITAHNGSKSIKISVPGNTDVISGYLQSGYISIEPAQTYVISAWVKKEAVLGTTPPAVRVFQVDSSKKIVGAQIILSFGSGTSDWEKRSATFKTENNASQIYVVSNLWKGYGTFWVDDIELAPKYGLINYLSAASGNVVKNPDSSVTQKSQANELDFTITYIPKGKFIEVHGDIQNLRNGDRALQIMYALPINATGWAWSDDIRKNRAINGQSRYENVYLIGDLRTQNNYPFSLISNGSSALSIAVPMNVPRIYRTEYDLKNGYSIQYDFGLSDGTLKIGPGHADFTFIIYKADAPEWSFRSAAKKYYDIYPQFFAKRNEKEGLWIANSSMFVSIPNMSDFGAAFDEGANIRFDNANRIYSFKYTEPWSWWRDYETNSVKPSFEQRMADLNDDLINGAGKTWRGFLPLDFAARAVYNSAPYDINGKMYLDESSYFWNFWGTWSQSFPTNPDPEVPPPNRLQISYKEYGLKNNVNGGFIDNWIFDNNSSWDSTISHAGSGHSAKISMITDRTDLISGAWKSDDIEAVPGANYTFSAWIKTEGASGGNKPAIRLVEADNSGKAITANGAIIQHILAASGANLEWAQYKKTLVSSSNTVKFYVYANIYKGNGTGWFDDVSLTKKDEETKNLVKDPGFEENRNGEQTIFGLDGLYIDSLQPYYAFGPLQNYRKEHWAYADNPLVFDYSTDKPVLLEALSHYEYLDNVSMDIRQRQGKLLIANLFPHGYNFYADKIDILGSEVPDELESSADSAIRRTLSYQKTNSDLMQWKWGETQDTITYEKMEKYVKKETFYGIFPSIANAGNDISYWSSPALYNRDRPLFKKYIPIIKEISKAGWEPIPYAATGNSNIWLERYGNLSAENLQFTVRTEASEAQSGTLNAEITKLGAEKNRLYNIAATELVNLNVANPAVSIGKDGTTAAIPVSIASNDTLVYKLEAKAIDAYAVPESGAVSVAVSKWNTTLPQGQVIAEFTADAANGDGVDFSVLSLKPNAKYIVKKDGASYAAVVSDSAGKIVFNNSDW